MTGDYLVYGGQGSGSTPVEATLTLLGAPYRVVERRVWEDKAAAEEMAKVNPQRQVPALVLPARHSGPGELMTESAAILIHLAEAHPEANLAPAPGSPLRPRFLRWMAYISAQIYALYWIRDDASRLAADPAHEPVILERTAARILDCWRMMDAQVQPEGRFLLGDDLSVLDLYLAVVSRWRPRRRAFYAAAPGLAPVVKAVDADPRLAAFWSDRMPFTDGWEG
ncbi:glutathione S-transferase family protein [Phenylobacterium sp. J426]|uniref:glutathione S-transferase family protein n=1 Tax=Phenylobacterium sp. J426 TaxID=2898439 RepID=UPI0021510C5E|nr:glutathione S-transferase family protein [Phenylobacterium sp. J426]MCR5873498.1 glutathione S-transferase family protein [Phenylobacterium sp. J426]